MWDLSEILLVCGDFLIRMFSSHSFSISLLSHPTLPVLEEVYYPIANSAITFLQHVQVEPCTFAYGVTLGRGTQICNSNREMFESKHHAHLFQKSTKPSI